MPIGNQYHRGVAVAVAIALSGFDQLLNLSLGQVLPAAKLAVWLASWGNCSFLGAWLH